MSRVARKSKRVSKKPRGEVEVVSGTSFLNNTTIVSGTAQTVLNLNPTNLNSVRLLALADNYRFFRFTRLEVDFNQGDGALEMGIVGYLPGEPIAAALTTTDEIAELDQVAWSVPGQTTRTRLQLSRAVLKGAYEWYYTAGFATEQLLETQGSLVFGTYLNTTGALTAGNLVTFFRWTVEFYGRSEASLSRSSAIAQIAPDAKEDKLTHPPDVVAEGDDIVAVEVDLVSKSSKPRLVSGGKSLLRATSFKR